MPFKMRIHLFLVFSLILLVILPPAGVYLMGDPLSVYMEFPPLTRYVRHAGPSWPAFFLVSGVLIIFLWPFVRRFSAAPAGPPEKIKSRCNFPWWGRASLLLCIVSWVLAWTRFQWFRPFQPYTFIPLWFSFVFTVNGLCHWHTGTCLLERFSWRFLLLFPVSSVFWWYFEYLNRFVQNWYYLGVETFSPLKYCLTATVSFSTVLPAVLSVNELLKCLPRFEGAFEAAWPVKSESPRVLAAAAFFISSAGLTATGIFPDLLFPLLWTGPLIIVTAVSSIIGLPTVFDGISRGSWTGVCRLAASGLICGFFWEMWNYYSQAKWIYSIPFVSQCRIFEMPVLGYAGYLPFGLECAVAASVVISLQDILASSSSLTARASPSKV